MVSARHKAVRDLVLADTAPCVPLTIIKRGHEIEYEARAVTVGGRRYILCRNHQEAEKDAAARQAILANLERQLARGDKALVGNTGFRRFLKTEGDGHFAVDAGKAEKDARFDGVFVLRTNTDLDPLAAMLRYKQLWTVEATFRTAKHLLATGRSSTSSTKPSAATRLRQFPRARAQGRAREPHRQPRPHGILDRDSPAS
jgi:hypothetical protein